MSYSRDIILNAYSESRPGQSLASGAKFGAKLLQQKQQLGNSAPNIAPDQRTQKQQLTNDPGQCFFFFFNYSLHKDSNAHIYKKLRRYPDFTNFAPNFAKWLGRNDLVRGKVENWGISPKTLPRTYLYIRYKKEVCLK